MKKRVSARRTDVPSAGGRSELREVPGWSQPGEGAADPASVLAAAEQAPEVFTMAAYYDAVALLRQKGRSWRDLAGWLEQFRIKISYVHLRRLYLREQERRRAAGLGPAAAAPAPVSEPEETDWTRL